MALNERERFLSEISEVMNTIYGSQVDMFEKLLFSSGEIFCYGMGRSGLAVRGFAMRCTYCSDY